MYEKLKANILKNTHIPEQELAKFCHLFYLKTVNKKEFLLKEGEICRFEGFVNSGLCKVYHLDEKGNEQILYFAAENWWVVDLDSFNTEQPSKLFIEALEDSELLMISKANKEMAFTEFPSIERVFRIMTQNVYTNLQRRMIDNLCKTADIRYVEFLQQYPSITKRLSNIQIAAYLGISHEFLSKIRRKLSEKK